MEVPIHSQFGAQRQTSFLNNGLLDESELTRPLIQVVILYEFIRVKIFGLFSDAGGDNTQIFRLLNVDCLSFKSPFDYNRTIYIWLCGTHMFKAMRNNVYRSQLTKSKLFTTHRVPFGWNEIEKTLKRDTERISQRTDLTKHLVYLDNFTIMNAGYANKCFSDRTISEIIVHIALLLHVKVLICNELLSQ